MCKISSYIFAALIANIFAISLVHGYDFPTPQVRVLHPRGFEVSIPDSPGLQLFAFHGNINREINGVEAGQFSVDIHRQQNGRWTYRNPTASLNFGDTLYFWVYAIVDGLGYQKLYQQYTRINNRFPAYD